MDALVKLVLERLEKRMTSTATFMVTECNSYDEHILLQNQLISFAGIDYGHIRELMSDTLVPWVACLHRALTYDLSLIHICFDHFSYDSTNLFPIHKLLSFLR